MGFIRYSAYLCYIYLLITMIYSKLNRHTNINCKIKRLLHLMLDRQD